MTRIWDFINRFLSCPTRYQELQVQFDVLRKQLGDVLNENIRLKTDISSKEEELNQLKDSLRNTEEFLASCQLLLDTAGRQQAEALDVAKIAIDEFTKLKASILYYKVPPPGIKAPLARETFFVTWDGDPLYRASWRAKLIGRKKEFELRTFGKEIIGNERILMLRPKQYGCPRADWERFFSTIQWKDATADGDVWDSASRHMVVYGLTRQPGWGDLAIFDCMGYSKLFGKTDYQMPGHPWMLVTTDTGELWRYDASTREFTPWDDERYVETETNQR